MSNIETCCRTLSLFFQGNETYGSVCVHTCVDICACVWSCCFFPRYPLNQFLPNLAVQSVENLAVSVSYKCHENRQPGWGGRTSSAPAGGEAAPWVQRVQLCELGSSSRAGCGSSTASAQLPAPLKVLQSLHAIHTLFRLFCLSSEFKLNSCKDFQLCEPSARRRKVQLQVGK